ncbi:hypothetical protein SAMN05216355_11827 [Actinomyces ruminicola]|uniref:Uncharacterized protein n=1 Tax=Actinomyces ruminicola TaxID=332524 RepID=A0A1H0ERJ8_9ACTO|nr:hypothetical protein [Actinomyces ruminicola]SDN84946.1 hypothetical protein SAMN05216355_11827 [Actinomyces ruminicola]
MDTTHILIMIATYALGIIMVVLTLPLLRGGARPGRARITEPVPGAGTATYEYPVQRPSAVVHIALGILFGGGILLLVLLSLPVVDDLRAAGVIAALALLSIGYGCYSLAAFRNCSLIDAPTLIAGTDWRGRALQIPHQEIASFSATGQRSSVVQDRRGRKLRLNMNWFSAPNLALYLLRATAEGRFPGKHPGDPRELNRGLNRVQSALNFQCAKPLREVLLQGPAANPAAFRRDPSAPTGTGWTGPEYEAWVGAVSAVFWS